MQNFDNIFRLLQKCLSGPWIYLAETLILEATKTVGGSMPYCGV